MTTPTRLQPREKKPQMTEPRADGPTKTNRPPTAAESSLATVRALRGQLN